MLYRFLGMAVWHGGKLFLRRRYGPTYVIAGAALAVAVAGGVALLAARHASDD